MITVNFNSVDEFLEELRKTKTNRAVYPESLSTIFPASHHKQEIMQKLREGESPDVLATRYPVSRRAIYRYLRDIQSEKMGKAKQARPPVVRLSCLITFFSALPNLRHISVVATYLAIDWLSAYKTLQTIMRLDVDCGDDWQLANDKAQATVKQIEDACQELGYEVRGGIMKESGE
jgi:hypothetical protein